MINEFSQITGIPADTILGHSRKKKIAIHRAIYWRLLHQTGFSYPQIAKLNDRKNHTTIMSAVKMVENALSVGIVEIKQIDEKTKHLKEEYMLSVEQIIRISPPEVIGERRQTREVIFCRCGYCKGKGWFYNDGWAEKFKQDLKAPNNKPCLYCKGTGKVKALVTVDWLPHGDVIEVKEDNEY